MTNPLAAPDRPAHDVPAAPPPRRLLRSRTDRVLGGVCGGLADYTGVDALLWRIAMVALVFLGPGVVIYPLLWLLAPEAP